MNLLTSYFTHSDSQRQEELNYVLNKNISNPVIKNIYLFIDDVTLTISDPKIKPIYIRSRPLYDTFFEVIRRHPEDWNIIANSDIYFDESLNNLRSYKRNIYCFPLTRYEVDGNEARFLNRNDSQDCWIFHGHPKEINGDFGLGVCGCDNAIAYRFERAGYICLNISKTIKSYHVHKSLQRDYDVNKRVPQPYKVMNPITDEDIERI